MQLPIEFAAADKEFYAPLDTLREEGGALQPAGVPEGWTSARSGVWTMWQRPGRTDLVDDGWKVHVSARPDRLREVLDRTAAVCFAQHIVFKHLSTKDMYWWTHAKFAQRAQSGKFIAAYPPDAVAAHRLMSALRAELRGEEGPYILTDRRFPDAGTVYYRYGAFRLRVRREPDGTGTLLTRDHGGNVVADRRGVSFQLPPGLTDPFTARRPAATTGGADLHGFAIESSIRFSNAGGSYRGRELATGRRVFIKEARAHTGLREDGATAVEQLREEWETLCALHAADPGLVPEPVSYFRAWEHEFLVTEHVYGPHLGHWVATEHPILRAGATVDDFDAFYRRAGHILASLDRTLARLHAAGYLFVDVSPSNLILTEDDTIRLVDLGSAHRVGDTFVRTGTPGYLPPEHLVGADLGLYDRYGAASIALHLVAPVHLARDRNPEVLAHLRYELARLAPVPETLWQRATEFHPHPDNPRLPLPEQVEADPVRHLTDLRDAVAGALVATADLDGRDWIFPTIPQGYTSNTVCLAYGTAGVVHALRRAGRALPDGLPERLRTDALDQAGKAGPGLYTGLAGLARALADLGRLDEARHLLAVADAHPLTGTCATLSGGAAGVALAHLALYGASRDESHVDRALALAAALPPDDALTDHLGADDAVGLMHGRCGVALMLQQLAGVTGDDTYLSRAVRLLHAELDRAADPDAPGLLLPVSATDRRAMPYLWAGSAGLAFAATRCVRAGADERLALALPRLLAPLRLRYTLQPGLFQGLAGYAFTLADHGDLMDDETSRQAARRAAGALFLHAVPHRTGVRFLGDQLLRYSTELWSGSAGVLLALSHVLDPQPDALFTVDALIDGRRAAGRRGVPVAAGRS